MKSPNLINDRLSPINDPSGEITENRSNRRTFLKTLGFVGVSAALTPTALIANPVKTFLKPSANAAWLASCDDWLSCVTDFVWIIAARDPGLARGIVDQLEASEIEEAPRYQGFHYRFAPLHAFSTKIDLKEVICGNGFMVNLFPYYGDCTCQSDYDMNAPEMKRVTARSETDFYNCVLAPAGKRLPLQGDYDHTEYRSLLANTYTKHDPDDWTLRYTRRLHSSNNGKYYKAFGIENRTGTDSSGKRAGDVLITPYDV